VQPVSARTRLLRLPSCRSKQGNPLRLDTKRDYNYIAVVIMLEHRT
jgi:hypothetical protein